jgi:peroxiredoxin Q/BCP
MVAGDDLPDLTVATTSGPLRLADLRGRPAVIYFYPKDATPGCTREALDFAGLQARFEAAGARLLGVSRDGLASHERFRSRQGLGFDLVSDPDQALCDAFGVIGEKSMYGKTVVGVIRSTFLFAADGRLHQAWRGVRVPGHAEQVLAAVEALA